MSVQHRCQMNLGQFKKKKKRHYSKIYLVRMYKYLRVCVSVCLCVCNSISKCLCAFVCVIYRRIQYLNHPSDMKAVGFKIPAQVPHLSFYLSTIKVPLHHPYSSHCFLHLTNTITHRDTMAFLFFSHSSSSSNTARSCINEHGCGLGGVRG